MPMTDAKIPKAMEVITSGEWTGFAMSFVALALFANDANKEAREVKGKTFPGLMASCFIRLTRSERVIW